MTRSVAGDLPDGPYQQQVFADRSALADGLAAAVAADARAAIGRNGDNRARLAVPGGSTPGPFLRALARLPLSWDRITLLLTDERCVAPDHPRSNERLLRECLADTPATQAEILSLGAVDDAALARCQEQVGKRGTPLDIAVLGMGEDGHTASLFPGADRLADALDPAGAAVLLPIQAPNAPEPRVTLTLPVLAAAASRYVLITGSAKAETLAWVAQPGEAAEAPIRAVFACAPHSTVMWAP